MVLTFTFISYHIAFTGQLRNSHLLNQLSHFSHLWASYGPFVAFLTFTGQVVILLIFTCQLSCSYLLNQLSHCSNLLASYDTHIFWASCHIAHISGQLRYSHLLNQLSHYSYLPASYDTHIYWNSCHIAHIYWPAMVITFTEPVVKLLTFIRQLWCPHLLDQLSHCSYLLASCGTHIYWTSCHNFLTFTG